MIMRDERVERGTGSGPILPIPRHSGKHTNVGTRPIVGMQRGCQTIFGASAPLLGCELVAQARVDAPALNVLAGSVVYAGIAKPPSIEDRGGRTESELAVSANPTC